MESFTHDLEEDVRVIFKEKCDECVFKSIASHVETACVSLEFLEINIIDADHVEEVLFHGEDLQVVSGDSSETLVEENYVDYLDGL